MSVYGGLKKASDKLLGRFGKTITITRSTSGAVDPVTGAWTPGTATTTTSRAVEEPYQLKEIDGTLVQQGDRRLYSVAEIKIGDTVTVDGISYRAIAVEPLAPGDTVIHYKAQVRV